MAGINGDSGITKKERIEKYILSKKIGEEFKANEMAMFLGKYLTVTESSGHLRTIDRVERVKAGTWRRIQ
jgi:hypothetical protein